MSTTGTTWSTARPAKWEDPFSDSAYTKRQTLYNIRLRDTRGVFTPQMIVHGRYQSGGSNESRIDSHVAEAKKTPPAVDIFIEGQAEKGYTSQIAGRLNGGETLNYAIYWLQETTVIPSRRKQRQDSQQPPHRQTDGARQRRANDASACRPLTPRGKDAPSGCNDRTTARCWPPPRCPTKLTAKHKSSFGRHGAKRFCRRRKLPSAPCRTTSSTPCPKRRPAALTAKTGTAPWGTEPCGRYKKETCWNAAASISPPSPPTNSPAAASIRYPSLAGKTPTGACGVSLVLHPLNAILPDRPPECPFL